MKITIVWPGRTRNRDIQKVQDYYIGKISRLSKCELVITKEARGIDEKNEKKIKATEAEGLEKHFGNDYIICLTDKGREMNSMEFARFLNDLRIRSGRGVLFVVGGFLGLDERLLKRADLRFSLSKMTFSHELIRPVLLEQIYRSLTIMKGKKYAK
jgi:23S rRNA (pseudouridine1915-N3)-methyltransferase